MELLEAVSDENLEKLIEKQYEHVRTATNDYWELVSERMVRTARRELGEEVGFLFLESDVSTGEMGLAAVYDRNGKILADWVDVRVDALNDPGKSGQSKEGAGFLAINEELHEGFLFDYIKRYGQEKSSLFSLERREQTSLQSFEQQFGSL